MIDFLIDNIPNEEDLVKFEEWKKMRQNEILVPCVGYGIVEETIFFVDGKYEGNYGV